MTHSARPSRARGRGFLPVLYTQRRGHCEPRAAPCARPAGTARPGPSCPSHSRGFFTFLIPREGARAGLGAVPLCPALPPGLPSLLVRRFVPTSSPWAPSLPLLPPHGPGRAGSPIWALRPPSSPHPAGLGFVGISFVAFYEEYPTPPRSPPHPPRGSTLSPPPAGPRDHSGWTNPGPGHLGLSPFPAAGEGRWGLLLTTPVAVPTSP